jgi:hypothetical protein
MEVDGVIGVQLQGRLAMCLGFADILPMFLISQKCRNKANTNFYKIFKNVYNENMRLKNFLKAPSIDHHVCMSVGVHLRTYRGADKSLARPGRKQATATEDFEFHTSYL